MKLNAGQRRFALRLLVVLALVLPAVHVFSQRYMIGFDSADPSCLPFRVYLIDRSDRSVQIGRFVAIRSQGIPARKDGTVLVKVVGAIPGDAYRVTETGFSVHGKHWGPVSADHLTALKTPLQPEGTPPAIVPEGRFLALGTTDVSYDSRYFGPIQADVVIGRAHPLW